MPKHRPPPLRQQTHREPRLTPDPIIPSSELGAPEPRSSQPPEIPHRATPRYRRLPVYCIFHRHGVAKHGLHAKYDGSGSSTASAASLREQSRPTAVQATQNQCCVCLPVFECPTFLSHRCLDLTPDCLWSGLILPNHYACSLNCNLPNFLRAQPSIALAYSNPI